MKGFMPRRVIWLSALLVAVAAQRGQSAELKGNVFDRTSTEIAGVSVTLSSLDRVLQTKSNANGYFQFENVRAGRYTLKLSAPGFEKRALPVAVFDDRPQSLAIVLQIGSVPDMDTCGPNPTIAYQAFGSNGRRLSGRVREYRGGNAITKAKIVLFRTGERHPAFMSLSDRMGKFEFDNVPAGYYDLRITRRSYLSGELARLLIPRENGVVIDFPLADRVIV